MNFSIGQIWQVSWIQGNEFLASHGRVQRTRTGILTGADAINGEAANLYFSLPMLEGRRNNSLTTKELQELHDQGKATLLGVLEIHPPTPLVDDPENIPPIRPK